MNNRPAAGTTPPARGAAAKGLTIVFTGDGKGKTTAALGCLLRTLGHGGRAALIHFMKTAVTGEDKLLERLATDVDVIFAGAGFYKIKGDRATEEEHRKAARDGLRQAERLLKAGGHRLIILDEINVAVSTGLLSEQEVIELIDMRPGDVDLILTGRNATDGIIAAAALVTEMKEVKHPFHAGQPPRKGIDF